MLFFLALLACAHDDCGAGATAGSDDALIDLADCAPYGTTHREPEGGASWDECYPQGYDSTYVDGWDEACGEAEDPA